MHTLKTVLALTLFLALLAGQGYCSTLTFDGSTNGNWSVGDNWTSDDANPGPPDTGDNVVFDAASPDCTVDSAAVCRNLTMTAYTHTLSGSSSINTYGFAVTLGAGMTFSKTGSLYMNDDCTLTTNGVSVTSSIGLPSSGKILLLADDLTCTGDYFYASLSSVNTQGHAVNCKEFYITGTATRTLTLTNSTITCTSFNAATTTGLTLTTTNSTINCSGAFAGGGKTYATVNITGDCAMSGTNTFTALNLTGGTLSGSDTQTITTFTQSGGVLTHTGIPTRYWIGGTGNWSDTAHWCGSSGGTGSASVPASTNPVVFDASSGAGTCTVASGGGVPCKSLDASTSSITTITKSGGNNINPFGSVTLKSGMTYTAGTIYISGSGTLTTNGVTIPSVTFAASGGTLTLGDDLTTSCTAAADFYVNNGTINTNGKTVTCREFYGYFSNTPSFNITNSTINCSSVSINTATAITSTGSTINCSGNFSGGGKTYATVNLTGTGALTGANTFGALTINGAGITVTNSTDAQTCSSLTLTAGTLAGTVGINCSGNVSVNQANSAYTNTGTLTITGDCTMNCDSAATGTVETLSCPITINGSGITCTLGSALNIGTKTLTLTAGTFDANDKDITIGKFQSSDNNTRTLLMGNGTWTVSYSGNSPWYIINTGTLTFDAESSQLTFTGAAPLVYASGLTYKKITFSALSGAGNTTGLFYLTSLTCYDLTIISAADNTTIVYIPMSITVTNALTITGNSAVNRLWVQSSVLGTQRTISCGSCNLSNCDLQDIAITASELITNGTFTSDASGWTTGGGATLTSTSSYATLTNGGADYGHAYQAFATRIGEKYNVSYSHKSGTSSPSALDIGTGTSGVSWYDLYASGNIADADWTTHTTTFVATSTTTYVSIWTGDNTTGHDTLFDNISVKSALDCSAGSVGGGTISNSSPSTLFTTPQTCTWDGSTSALWNVADNWTGSTSNAVPLIQDTAVFSGNLTGVTVTANMRLLPSIDTSGATGNPTLAFTSNYIINSCDFSNTTVTSTALYFYNSSNINFKPPTTMTGSIWTYYPGKTTTLTGNLVISGTGTIQHKAGTLDFNDFNVSAYQLAMSSTATKVLNMGNGTITLSKTGTGSTVSPMEVWMSGTTINAEGSTLVFSGTGGASQIYRDAGTLAFNNLTYTGDNTFSILYTNSFRQITLNSASAQTLTLPASTTTTFTGEGIKVGSGAQGRKTVQSSTASTAATLTKASGVLCVDLRGGSMVDITLASGKLGTILNWGSVVRCSTNWNRFLPGSY